MSQKARQNASDRNRQPEVLIFAENKNDSDAIKCLAESLNPSMRVRLVVQRDPTSLTRHAQERAVRSWIDRIAGAVHARTRLATVVGVLVHQDSDGPDPDGRVAKALGEKLNALLKTTSHPVVPVQETESWWFLYPDAFRSVNRIAWKGLKLPSKQDTDGIISPKERLIRLTRPTKRTYAEADSLAVAQQMADAVRRGESPLNHSASWSRFVALARSL
ncbi:hypothetical protein ACFWHT_13250 [Microbacterium sp. NPDC058342]|uniref:hypothetical protein n=1 Tax=Microbacterium sp. NPDC058342 TaxID=3346454 RepID=UPI00364E5534